MAQGQATDEIPPAAPMYSRLGADTCLACHDDDVTLAVFRDRHGEPSLAHGPFGPGGLQCEACHGPGGAHAARVPRGQARPPVVLFGFARSTPLREQNAMCTHCHQGDLGAAWHGSAHAGDRMACSDCHLIHARAEPGRAFGTRLGSRSDAAMSTVTCEGCHRLQSAEHLKPHSHPLRQGAMTCASCHSVHGAAGEALLTRNSLNETCFQCHADKRGPFLWEHAPASESCALCHEPHGSAQPGMLTQRGPLLCQGCHSQAGHPSIAAAPTGAPSAYVLARNCMNCHSQVHGSNHPSGSRLMR